MAGEGRVPTGRTITAAVAMAPAPTDVAARPHPPHYSIERGTLNEGLRRHLNIPLYGRPRAQDQVGGILSS